MRRLCQALAAAAVLALGGLLLLKGGEAAQGVREGIDLCLTSVVPSLFLFLVLTDFLAIQGLDRLLARPFSFLGPILGIPAQTVPVFLLSLIGGYPVGAKALARLVRQNQLEPKTAERLLCFCVNCSPAFLITGVSLPCFGRADIGAALYACQVLAALGVGLLTRFLFGADQREALLEKGSWPPVSQSLVQAVNAGVKAMAAICAFVLVFSAAAHSLSSIPGGEVLAGLLEVSIGCGRLPGKGGKEMAFLAVLYTASGGVCVWTQTACFLRGTGVKMGKSLLMRAVYVLLSLGLSMLALGWLPLPSFSPAEPVMSGAAQIWAARGAATKGASLLLVLLCLMFLLCQKEPRYGDES